MWVLYAFGSALFAGITAILAKCGIRNTDSNVATALRTGVVLVFAWIMAFLAGSVPTMVTLSGKTWVFLILSGFATGASWLCYFKALQLGTVNQVVPVDKSSTILTILFAALFLGESITWIKGIAIFILALGTGLMIQKKDTATAGTGKGWFFYAVLSAVFASLTAILGKIGIDGVESNLGTAIRTAVVLIMAWVVVFTTHKRHTLRQVPKKELRFICLSGLATGASWLCYYRALQTGPASIVVPIDKLSIVLCIAFSYFVFGERLTKRAFYGLIFVVTGTLALLL